MKSLLTVIALSVAAAVTATAFAQSPNPPTQSECDKMLDKRWDPNSKMCLPK